jgi:hypothetical protein
MSTQTAGEGRPAPASPPRGISNRRFLIMVLPAVLLAVVVLALFVQPVIVPAVIGLIPLVPPDAVQVSASAAPYGPTLDTHTIRDARTVADLYARLNRLPLVRRPFGCVLAFPDPVAYMFRFTRRSVLVDVATSVAPGCSPRRWLVSRGGDSFLRVDWTGEATRAILAEAQLPPLPSQP